MIREGQRKLYWPFGRVFEVPSIETSWKKSDPSTFERNDPYINPRIFDVTTAAVNAKRWRETRGL